MDRFGEQVYNSLTKSMKNALAQDQMVNEPEVEYGTDFNLITLYFTNHQL